MASGTDNWIADTVGDFIHSPIWSAPVRTFINANCLIFEYDDDDDNDTDERNEKLIILEEQKNIFTKYQRLVDALVTSLGKDLDLDENEVTKACQIPVSLDDSILSDERYEQLYSARDFDLFQNMMRKRNLILQLQALISLQLQWGLIKPGDTRDDLIVSLLSQATGSSSSRRGSTTLSQEPTHIPVIKQQARREEQKPKHNDNDDDDDDDSDVVTPRKEPTPSLRKTKPKVEPKQAPKEERRLPNLRPKGVPDLDAQWHRDLRRGDSKSDDDDNSADNDQSQNESALQTISAIPEKVLRQKLRDLTERTSSAVDDETASAIRERQKFLEAQRKKIIENQRAKHAQELEQEAPHARPQSARRAQQLMKTENEKKQTEEEQKQQIPNDEIKKRQTLMAKLKREVVDKK